MSIQTQTTVIMPLLTLILYYRRDSRHFGLTVLFCIIRQPYAAPPSITYEISIENGEKLRKWTNEYLLVSITNFVDQTLLHYYKLTVAGCLYNFEDMVGIIDIKKV